MTALLDEVRALLAEAGRAITSGPDAEELAGIVARLDEPLRVAFAGRVKAGKSTLLNALVGEELAPTDAGECTKIVTWYADGHTYRVTLHRRDGTNRATSFSRDGGALQVDLGGASPEDLERIEVEWPSSRLAGMTLIDTPGLASATEGASAPSQRFLAIGDEDRGPGQADAVIYLMRHLHQADLGFLEAFRDDTVGTATPANTIAVLSRADEVGACRPEAMQTARRIALRYRDDARLRRLCQTVVPVSGLLAQAAVTLTEAEYRGLAELAQRPREEIEALLLTVDRFVAEDAEPLTAVEREHLLERFGLYGVRSAIRLIRHGAAPSASELAVQLRELSGIEQLRRLLLDLFGARRDVLKARAALSALDAIVRENRTAAGEDLQLRLERVVASAHELRELDVVNTVRSGMVPLSPDEVAEVERLLDQPSLTVAERLGAEPGQERAAIVDAIERWRRRAEHPMSTRAVTVTADAIVRSLEGLLVHITTPADATPHR